MCQKVTQIASHSLFILFHNSPSRANNIIPQSLRGRNVLIPAFPLLLLWLLHSNVIQGLLEEPSFGLPVSESILHPTASTSSLSLCQCHCLWQYFSKRVSMNESICMVNAIEEKVEVVFNDISESPLC